MIREEIICDLLEKEIPEITLDIEKLPDSDSYVTAIRCFTNYTAGLIEVGKHQKLQKCFQIAENLLQNGTERIKSVVTAQFMLHIYPVLKASSAKTDQVKEMLQGHLLNQYRFSVSMDRWD